MINKIFIVYTEHDDGNRVNSVFSSRDEAEKHIKGLIQGN